MTEEYFCVEEIQDESKFYEGFDSSDKGKNAEVCDNNSNRISQNIRLHEMEEQLEIAENRCNTLKGQLDHMKRLYQSKTENMKIIKPHHKKTLYSACDPSPKRNPMEPTLYLPRCADVRSSSSLNRGDKLMLPIRQNSQAISTDTSGAAVQTINNILNGITDSVNRLSQIQVHIDSDRPNSRICNKTRDSACGDDIPFDRVEIVCTPRLMPNEERREEEEEEAKVGSDNRKEQENNKTFEKRAKQNSAAVTIANVRQQSSTVLSIKSKSTMKRKGRRRTHYNNKNVMQNSTITVNITNKKSLKSTAKHVEKRFKIEPVKMISKDSSSILSPKKSKKQMRRPRPKIGFGSPTRKNKTLTKHATIVETDKLVELYHNNAAKGSDTDDSNPEVRKCKDKEHKSSSETVPSLTFDDASDTNIPKQNQQQKIGSMYSNFGNKQLSPIDEHGYLEPTAPRTESYNMYSKNYELPTIASKMKQVAKSYMKRFNFHSIPFCAAKSTSPSHNIGINIQQVMRIIRTRQPVTGISPTLAHNIGLAAEKLQGSPFATMVSSIGSRVGYRTAHCPLLKHNINYQHLQEMAKEIPEEQCEDGSLKQMAEEEMASGDKNTPVWTVDPATQKNCTCIPQHGVGFQQVLSRYNTNSYSASTVSQFQYRMKQRGSKFQQTAKVRNKALSLTKSINKPVENKPSGPLRGKEKNLKEVLTNLHDEFAYINQQYDTLSKTIEDMGSDVDEDCLKQMAQLERLLNNKEEEITMVMTLYKEVMNLKQQVKTLKERASVASLSLNMQQPYPQLQQQTRFCNEGHTAVHLTKLLRQIQTYQEMNRIGRRN